MEIRVGKYILDKEQTSIATDESNHLLVVAGAGSGKTLTILGKIKYLLEIKGLNPNEILCISFTAKASKDLKRKIIEDLNMDIDVYTFHKLALNILSTSFNYDIAEDSLLEDIIHRYFYEDVFNVNDSLNIVKQYFSLKNEESYKKFLKDNTNDLKILERLLSTFIHLFKASNYQLEDFLIFLDNAKMTLNIKKYKREKLLLKIALNIYMIYKNYLEENDEIDFDDMLTKATKAVEKVDIFNNLKYVIIDEFQDTSKVRFDLIQSILKKTNAKLVAVGDDFQSIYRFTGCDLSLFLDFKKMYSDTKILKIEKTYRNSQELINVAGKFVMKNKDQIKKKLRSDKSITKPIVIKEYTYAFKGLIEVINHLIQEGKKEIMILGRNNKDIYEYLDGEIMKINGEQITLINHPDVNIRYLTAHKSKGLECDNVIIVNLKNSKLGFPNHIKDDEILRFVSPHASIFPFDEERRLFYVALTRTKNQVFLLVPNANRSIFIDELIKDYAKYIEYL